MAVNALTREPHASFPPDSTVVASPPWLRGRGRDPPFPSTPEQVTWALESDQTRAGAQFSGPCLCVASGKVFDLGAYKLL